jgi:hypothetical protein
VSVLYPRLLGRVARELHEEYVGMEVEELQSKAALRHRSAIFTATGGVRVHTEQLQALREQVLAEAVKANYPYPGTRDGRAEFDLRVAKLLHERSGLVPAEASVRSTWAFLALVLLPDVAYWRYPRAPGDRVLDTDITRHVFGRLWWRAHLLEDPNVVGDRYARIGVFGEAAFDQIFSRRRSLGGSRTLIRALARTWPRLGLEQKDERTVLREVLKRFKRLGAIVDFEALDDEELARQVAEVADEVVTALQLRG